MAEIVLVRHGETAWSLSGQHTGTTDIPLTDRGRLQGKALAAVLAGRRFGAVFCSPRQRARDTAQLAGLRDPQIEDQLCEWDYGGYEGRTTTEISADLGRDWSLWRDGVVPGATPGESADQVGARAATVIANATPFLNNGEDVALVAHGHILRVVAATWLGLPVAAGALFSLSTGSLSRLGFEHQRPAMASWNHVPDSLP